MSCLGPVAVRPVVKLEMDPPTPVNELAKMNITLICRVEAGNPDVSTALIDPSTLQPCPSDAPV